MCHLRLLTVCFLFLTTSLALGAADSAAITPDKIEKLPLATKAPVDFARDVQPLFVERCYKCHGSEKQKNGFRLDRKADALAGGDSGPSILPGKSAESRLIHYVAGLDEEKIMPPKGERLTAGQIGLL